MPEKAPLWSAAGMQKAGRSEGYIFGVWGGVAIVSGIAALAGYALFQLLVRRCGCPPAGRL